ncbi:MAG: response regulator transcription factor [Dehalococcoidales bacterium]|nr:response regulator transcription factor [Dehalococcoidales bacterium]
MKILIIEDDKSMAEFIGKGLTEEGYTVTTAGDGEKGQSIAEDTFHDLIVLDILLPGKNGLEVCRELRNRKIGSRILMLSCKGTVIERVEGLNAGADDYLAKPFEFSELYARIRALLRRDVNNGSPLVSVRNLTLNTVSKEVRLNEEPVQLTRTEYAILFFLLFNLDNVVSKTMLESHIWNTSSVVESNMIEVHVGRLRDKLGGRGKDNIIRTVRGFGYMISSV